MTSEQKYWQDVREAAARIAERVEDGEDEYEALHEEADNHMIYYRDIRATIAHTDNLDAVEDVGITADDDVWKILTQIAYFAFEADVRGVYEREGY